MLSSASLLYTEVAYPTVCLCRWRWQRACRRQWRPSRLESDCILGEGITVQFPDTRCTVLDRTLAGSGISHFIRLCWLWGCLFSS